MKNLFSILVLILFYTCSDETLSIPREKIEYIKDIAQPAASELMKQLKDALVRTIEDSGMVAAIAVCKNMAPDIAKSVVQNMPHVVEIGRTSLKVRSVSNSPDVTDVLAIRYFEDQIRKAPDSSSGFYIVDDGKFYRYYQPILIQPLCLNCHGDKSTMQKDVISAIEKHYPQDRAYGFNINDLRGLLRVKITKDNKSSQSVLRELILPSPV